MRDTTLRIKNLSIALEALSRINNEGSPNLYDAIAQALEKELGNLSKEQYPELFVNKADPNDDIPF